MRRFRAFVVAFLVATFVISLPARSSMAVMQIPYNTIVYGPLDIGGIFGLPVVEGVGVCAHDKYAAAMTALGYGGDVVTGLDANKKALLSNQSTGGAFWTFAQHFVNPSSSGNLTERMVYRYAELYGSGVVWAAEYQESEKAPAVVALQNVLNGSGGGGDVEDGYVYYDCVRTGWENTSYSDIAGVALHRRYNLSIDETIKANPDKGLKLWIGFGKTSPFVTVNVHSAMPNINANYTYTWAYGYSFNAVYPRGGFWQSNTPDVVMNDGKKYVVVSANPDTVQTNWTVAIGSTVTDALSPLYSYYYGDVVTTPATPPTNWPDAPQEPEPTAPDVPEPTTTDAPSQPAMPTAPDLPDFPSNIISPGTSYDTFDIQAILDAMDEHCQHLQSAIYQGFADYFDTFTPWLDERLETLQECIRGESIWQIQRIDADFESLKDYLHDLFRWLADQMEFTFTADSYDDSSVVSWLRRIYFKLQSSPVNTRPADPVANPDDAWDWLWQLLQDILTGLTGGATELVGKLMNLFDGIKDKFPFSVPWDLAAVLVLLDVPAQTPAFVISYDVFGTTVTYDIDLHFMDDYAGVIRSMETVLFCFMLIKNTKWLTGIFDEVGQFLGTKLGYRG